MGSGTKKILLSGASGFVGTALIKFFATKNVEIFRLVRQKINLAPNEIFWDPQNGILNPDSLEGVNTVIHLSGETIAQRWTTSAKKRISESRVLSTQTLVSAILKCKNPPQNFFGASATGFYGHRLGEVLTENSPRGEGWAAELCERWENATSPLKNTGRRVVHMRFGIVLSPNGGALAKMLKIFKWGLGSPLGSGQQMMSWIALPDLTRAVWHCLGQDELSGPVNFTAPQAISNHDFSKALAQTLHRPLMPAIPEFAVKIIFGQMGRELLLANQKVIPQKLQQSGFKFDYGNLAACLTSLGW